MERENIETKAWVPLQGAESESIYCEQPREQVKPSNERDPISFSTCETAPVQTGLLTSSAQITQPERPSSVGTTSTSSVTEISIFCANRSYSQCTHNICCNNSGIQFVPVVSIFHSAICSHCTMEYSRSPSTSHSLSNQPVSSNNLHQAPEQHTVGTGHHGPFVMDSGQALQQLAVSVAERQRKCPKFSGESKCDDFDHWLQNIFRFYVPLDQYDERGKLL